MYLRSLSRTIVAKAHSLADAGLARLCGKVVILMYHRVVTEKELTESYIQPGMYVKAEAFTMQMRFLRERFAVLSFEELIERWRHSDFDAARRYAVVTFDDGWLDNYLHAFPTLKKYGIPATIFLPTDFIGTDRWFWPERLAYLIRHASNRKKALQEVLSSYPVLAGLGGGRNGGGIEETIAGCKSMAEHEIEGLIEAVGRCADRSLPRQRVLLNWDEVSEMSRDGISFGSHSRNHRILTHCSSDVMWSEIRESLFTLRRMQGASIPVFCYPNGNYTGEIAECVREAGYSAAVSTRPGTENFIPGDLFSLKRRGVHNDVSSTESLFAYHMGRK